MSISRDRDGRLRAAEEGYASEFARPSPWQGRSSALREEGVRVAPATIVKNRSVAIRSTARSRRSDRRRSGLLRAAFFNRCVVLSALVLRKLRLASETTAAPSAMEASGWVRTDDRERQSS